MSRKPVKDRGAINFVNVFLVLLLVAGAYLAWIYIPPYVDFFGVRKAVRVACNRAYRDRSEDMVRDTVMREWADLKIQDDELEDGKITRKPTPFERVANVDVEFSKDPPSVMINVHYTQHIVFPFLNKEKDLEFEYSHTEDLSTIKY